ncbi:response regulator [Noviherbaspirillum agri]
MKTQETTGDERRFNALVIEDNRDYAKLFCDLLNVLGGSAEIASSAQAGMEKAAAMPPDIVFCDIGLPGDKSGVDFARAFRQDGRFGKIPVIAVTGLNYTDGQGHDLRADFHDVFEKPVKFGQLFRVLRNLQLC